MRIEALILARDEASNLAACIHSVRPAVDMVTVFDTGSSDGSRAVAQENGARFVSIAFREDFAAMRNCALQQSCGDWILVIDADERLDTDGVGAIGVHLRASEPAPVMHLEQRTYTDDVDSLGYVALSAAESIQRGAAGYVPRLQPRLFQAAHFHYEGLCSERLLDVRGFEPDFTPAIAVLHHLRELEPLTQRQRRHDLRLRLSLRDVLQNQEVSCLARLGALLNQQGRWQAALSYLRAAEEDAAEHAPVHMQAGLARLHLGLVEGAVASFRRAAQAFPGHPEVATWLARALIQSGSPAGLFEAGVLLDEALEIAPEIDQTILQKAIWHRKLGEFSEARAYLQTLLERNPLHPFGLKELGTIAVLQGRVQEAEQHLRQALRFRPEDAELLNNLGCTLERRGLWPEALQYFVAASDAAGNDARYLYNSCIAAAACRKHGVLFRNAERALFASDQPGEFLRRLREDCLDAGWVKSLQKLEDWATRAQWLREDERILSTSETLTPEPA